MTAHTPEYYEALFNDHHGRFGNWQKFRALVEMRVQASEIRRQWGDPGSPMAKPTYYKWRKRVLELGVAK